MSGITDKTGAFKKRTHSRQSSKTPVSSNWKNIQSTLPKVPASVKAKQDVKRRLRLQLAIPNVHEPMSGISGLDETTNDVSLSLHHILLKGAESVPVSKKIDIGKYLAIDCEMVGVGPNGCESVLARVSIVNYYGTIIYDTYVSPKEKVTDYRTWVSGIKPEHLKDASPFGEVAAKVANLIKGKILIGHAITNDLQALLLKHPRPLLRDTSTYPPLRTLAKTKFPSLKKLATLLLKVEIQGSEHSSVDDARATMAVYRTQKDVWESSLRSLVNSSTAPIFRHPSRSSTAAPNKTLSGDAFAAPTTPVASSSKPPTTDKHPSNQLEDSMDHGSSAPVTELSEAKAEVKTIPDTQADVQDKLSTVGNPSNKHSTRQKSTSGPVTHVDCMAPSSPGFKRPRTTNLHLSATLQHIRNEAETSQEGQNRPPSKPSTINHPSRKIDVSGSSSGHKIVKSSEPPNNANSFSKANVDPAGPKKVSEHDRRGRSAQPPSKRVTKPYIRKSDAGGVQGNSSHGPPRAQSKQPAGWWET